MDADQRMEDERIAAVNRLRCLAEELYLLEACCHPEKRFHLGEKPGRTSIIDQSCPTKTSPRSRENSRSPSNRRDSECFAIRCQIPRCRSNPGAEPIITWVPVRELRKTSLDKRKLEDLNRQNPLTKYETTENKANCGRRTSFTKDSPFIKICSSLKDFKVSRKSSRENFLERCSEKECDSDPCSRASSPERSSRGERAIENMFYVIPASPSRSPVKVCLTNESPSKRTQSPRYRGTPQKAGESRKSLEDIDLCCSRRGPLMDKNGQAYTCQVTLDGRQICKPQYDSDDLVCCTDDDNKVFPKCYGKTRIFTRAKVLNQRKNSVCCESAVHYHKRPVFPLPSANGSRTKNKCRPILKTRPPWQ